MLVMTLVTQNTHNCKTQETNTVDMMQVAIIPAPSARGVKTSMMKVNRWYQPMPISLMISGSRCAVSGCDRSARLLTCSVICDPLKLEAS